uniref:RING-type domain-containing protein n=1 Tax=Myripristis murdjan TaxID=586833 RepID=A0A667WRP8_9TELE
MAEPHIPVKRDHLCCRICRTFLRNPATIPCGHNFCTLCIQESWDNKERNGYLFSCPECYFTFSSRPQLITNTTLAELVNDTQRGKSGAGSKTEQSCSAGSTGEPQTPKRPRTSIEQRESGSDICRRHLTCSGLGHGLTKLIGFYSLGSTSPLNKLHDNPSTIFKDIWSWVALDERSQGHQS